MHYDVSSIYVAVRGKASQIYSIRDHLGGLSDKVLPATIKEVKDRVSVYKSAKPDKVVVACWEFSDDSDLICLEKILNELPDLEAAVKMEARISTNGAHIPFSFYCPSSRGTLGIDRDFVGCIKESNEFNIHICSSTLTVPSKFTDLHGKPCDLDLLQINGPNFLIFYNSWTADPGETFTNLECAGFILCRSAEGSWSTVYSFLDNDYCREYRADDWAPDDKTYEWDRIKSVAPEDYDYPIMGQAALEAHYNNTFRLTELLRPSTSGSYSWQYKVGDRPYLEEFLREAMKLLLPKRNLTVKVRGDYPCIWDSEGNEYYLGGLISCTVENTVDWGFPEDCDWVPEDDGVYRYDSEWEKFYIRYL